VPWLAGAARLVAVGGETGLPVDDVGALTDSNGFVVIQAKGRLTLSRQRTAALADAVDQVVRQFLDGVPDGDSDSTRPVDEVRDRLVIAGHGRSSQPIRELGKVTMRLRTLPSAVPMSSAATNQVQARGLTTLIAHIRHAWRTATSTNPSDEDIRALLRVVVIDVLDLDDRGEDRATAMAHLRSALLDPAKDARAWTGLHDLGRTLSEQRAWRRRADIADELDAIGAPVGPVRCYAADVRTLRRLSDANLAALAAHSGLPISGGLIRCERPAIQDLVDVDGSFVLVGDPGCGKSAVAYELASRIAATEDVVVLSVENLAGSSGATHAELGLAADLAEILEGWSGAGRATLMLDGLEAARGEGTTWLARLCESLHRTRWRIIASIRRFDLQHSLHWQRVFRGEPVVPGGNNQAPDLPEVRHYLLGDLEDRDLAQLATASATIASLLNGASTRMVQLVRNPFNLRLAVELLEAGASVSSLADTRDQLQLLQRYWRLRVIDAPDGSRRIRALSAVTNAMLVSRRLRADASVVPDAVLTATDELLRDGVLHESPTPLLAQGSAVLVFSHHILFDFAVAALVFTSAGESRLAACLRDNASLTIITRPSIDLHLADIWHADAAHSAFAAIVRDFVADDHAVAGVAAARTAAENVRDPADLNWLTEEFRANPNVATIFIGWLCGAMDAADARLVDRLRAALPIWADMTDAVAETIERQFVPATGQTLFRLLFQLNKIDPLVPTSGGAIVRANSAARLMAVCLAAPDDRAWLAGPAAQLLPRAVAVDAAHARTVLRAINGASFAAFGSEVMRRLVEGIEFVAEGDPDAATEVLLTLWTWHQERDETTHITHGVLNLSSTRRQDLDNVKWLFGEKFPAFTAKSGLLRAVKVVATTLRAGSERHPARTPERIDAFGAEGELLPIANDLSYGPGHGVASTVVEVFLGALGAEPASEADAVAVVKEMVASISHPEFWRKLLVAACDLPGWRKPVTTVLASGALLMNPETRPAAGKLIRLLSGTLDIADHAKLLEEPIRRAAALFPPHAAKWRERTIDELVSCLDVTRVQDPELRLRMMRMLAEGDPPKTPERVGLEEFSELLDLRDVLGGEIHGRLGEGARNALDELRLALAGTEGDGAISTVPAIAAALDRVVVEPGILNAEPVRELITRAADRLAQESSVQPQTDLGELVAQTLLSAASDEGSTS
jgi:hypothetical protein